MVSGRSSSATPSPLSRMRISLTPPSSTSISRRVAPASRLFSSSSLTTEAGRSTTSPAAIWLASRGDNRLILAKTKEPCSGIGDTQHLTHFYHAGIAEGIVPHQAGEADLIAYGNVGKGFTPFDAMVAGDQAGLGIPAPFVAQRKVGARRWMLVEILDDAFADGLRQLGLMGLGTQVALFRRIGNEAGFHQDRWDIRGFQHGKPGLFHPFFVQVSHPAHLLQHVVAHLHAVLHAAFH